MLIERALGQLDTDEPRCKHCDGRVFRDDQHRVQSKINMNLSDVPRKLTNAASKLEFLKASDRGGVE